MIEKGGAILKIISILIIVMILLKLCLIFLWPFAGAVMLVILVEPMIGFIKRLGFSRKTSAIVGFGGMLLIIFLAVYYLSSYMYIHFSGIINKLPQVIKTLNDKIIFLNEREIDYNKIINSLEQFVLSYRVKIFNTLMSTVGGAIYAIIIVINTIFISLDLEKIDSRLKKMLPQITYIIGCNVLKKISSVMKVEIKLMFVSILHTVIGLYVLGQDDALTIGLICGILDLLPVVGPGMIFIPWALYAIVVHNYFLAIGLILLYILLEINREIMHIKFMGKSLRMHPVVTIFSLYVGLILYGMWGVILGPMLIILFQELFNYYYEGRHF